MAFTVALATMVAETADRTHDDCMVKLKGKENKEKK
jgi:hypothetical protein